VSDPHVAVIALGTGEESGSELRRAGGPAHGVRRRRGEAGGAQGAVLRGGDLPGLWRGPGGHGGRAVVLATPAVTHAALARGAIEAGKDVYVEKPLALTASDGRGLIALAQERKRILMVGISCATIRGSSGSRPWWMPASWARSSTSTRTG